MTVYVIGGDEKFRILPGFTHVITYKDNEDIEVARPSLAGIKSACPDIFQEGHEKAGLVKVSTYCFSGLYSIYIRGDSQLLFCYDNYKLDTVDFLSKILDLCIRLKLSYIALDVIRGSGTGYPDRSRKTVVNKMVKALKQFEDAHPLVQVNVHCDDKDLLAFLSTQNFQVDTAGIARLFA